MPKLSKETTEFLKKIEKTKEKNIESLEDIFKKYGIKGVNTEDKYDDKRKTRVPIPLGMKTKVLILSKGKCQKCKLSLKNIKPDIHHMNQDPSDNNIKNLKVLCPNCHTKMHYNEDGTRKKE